MELTNLYQQLLDAYGPQDWWPAQTPFEMALGAVLTQNTAWTNVERAIANLRAADALTPAGLRRLAAGQLEALIRPSGFFNQKTARIRALVAYLDNHWQGDLLRLLARPLAEARAALLDLQGIGPETADAILLYAGAHPTFVVDAYTRRLGERLGLLDGGESYEGIRHLFMASLPEDAAMYNEFHALIVRHAKDHCRKTPLCGDCPLLRDCPTGIYLLRTASPGRRFDPGLDRKGL